MIFNIYNYIKYLFSRWMSDGMIAAMTPALLGDYPNTYTLTKGLAEHIVTTENGDMPVTVVRPSIIAGSYKEPSPVSEILPVAGP